MNIKKFIRHLKMHKIIKGKMEDYYRKFKKYSYIDCECENLEQFQASITRLYHTIEKGLAYHDYRAGFGRENIEKLIESLSQYSKMGYDCSAFFYETALSCLKAYIEKNKENGLRDITLEERIDSLPGKANAYGGAILISKPAYPQTMNYAQLMSSRHSIRHFSNQPVDEKVLMEAIELAQYTPSACNRQGWKTRIVSDKEKIQIILSNQNGNKGFGQEIDKILIVTADIRAQQRSREVFQAFIDGGMYAESILNAIHFKGLGSVPLSAALTPSQDRTIKNTLRIDDAELLILFIGVGNYPEEATLTTRSERRPIDSIQVL